MVSNLHTTALVAVVSIAMLLLGVVGGGQLMIWYTNRQAARGKEASNTAVGVFLVAGLLSWVAVLMFSEHIIGPVDLGEQRVIYELRPTEAKGAEARTTGLFLRRTSGKGGSSYAWIIKTVRPDSGETIRAAKLTGGRQGNLERRQVRGHLMRLSGRKQVVFADLYAGEKIGEGEDMLEADPRLKGKTWRPLTSKGWELRAQLQSGEEVVVEPPATKTMPVQIESVSAKSHCAVSSHAQRRHDNTPKAERTLYGLLRTRRARIGERACAWTYKDKPADVVYHSSAAFGEGDDLLSVVQDGKPVVTIPMKPSLGSLYDDEWSLWKLQLLGDHLEGYYVRDNRSTARVRWRLSDGALVASTLLW